MLPRPKRSDKSGQEILLEVESPARPPRRGEFLRRYWKPLAVVLCGAAVAAAALLPRPGTASAGVDQQYQTASPQKRSIRSTFSDSGTLSAASTYTVQPLVKGTVLTADFEVGDEIQAGQVLYTISASSAEASVESARLSLQQAQASYQEALSAQALQADISGRLCELSVRVGDTVSAGQQLAVVRDDSQLLLEATFSAAEAAAFAPGQSAQVTLNGTFETLAGEVVSVSGAAAQGSPSAANADGSRTALEGYVYVPVATGVSDKDYVEITGGLTQEDTIAYDPSLASGQQERTQQQMPGGMPGEGGRGGMSGGGPGGGF